MCHKDDCATELRLALEKSSIQKVWPRQLGLCGSLLGASGGLLGVPWGFLREPVGAQDSKCPFSPLAGTASWSRLGGLSALSGRLLGSPWGLSGLSYTVWGLSWRRLGPPRNVGKPNKRENYHLSKTLETSMVFECVGAVERPRGAILGRRRRLAGAEAPAPAPEAAAPLAGATGPLVATAAAPRRTSGAARRSARPTPKRAARRRGGRRGAVDAAPEFARHDPLAAERGARRVQTWDWQKDSGLSRGPLGAVVG